MTDRDARAPGPTFRLAHLALATAGAAGAAGVLALDPAEWTAWLTAGGEPTPSRQERVAMARGLVAVAAGAVALLGIAGAAAPAPVRDRYGRVERAVCAAVAARRRPLRLGRVAAGSLLAVAALLVLAYGVHRLTGTPLVDLVRDPASVAGVPPWIGLLSNLGVLLWAAAAAICFLGAAVLGLGEEGAAHRRREFLWASGALTAVLALDDALLLHESVLPALTGFPEIAFSAVYPALVLAYLVRYGATLLAAEWPLWAAAAALLAASMGLDTVFASVRRAFVEDAFKLAGIVFWLAFYARTVHAWLAAEGARAAR